MVLWWNQRRKQGSNFGVGGQGLLLRVQNQGSTTVLSQKGDGCIVFPPVLFFVDSAVFFICKGSPETRCIVFSPVLFFVDSAIFFICKGSPETQGVFAWCENHCEASKQQCCIVDSTIKPAG